MDECQPFLWSQVCSLAFAFTLVLTGMCSSTCSTAPAQKSGIFACGHSFDPVEAMGKLILPNADILGSHMACGKWQVNLWQGAGNNYFRDSSSSCTNPNGGVSFLHLIIMAYDRFSVVSEGKLKEGVCENMGTPQWQIYNREEPVKCTAQLAC